MQLLYCNELDSLRLNLHQLIDTVKQVSLSCEWANSVCLFAYFMHKNSNILQTKLEPIK